MGSLVNAQEAKYRLGENDMFSVPDTLPQPDTANYGAVNLIQDTHIKALVEKHIQINKYQEGLSGWRIQIYFGTGKKARSTAEYLKKEFTEKYVVYPAYLDYERPYFKVRVGDFRTRNEALKLKKEIERTYPNSWVVKDIIQFPKLANEIEAELNKIED